MKYFVMTIDVYCNRFLRILASCRSSKCYDVGAATAAYSYVGILYYPLFLEVYYFLNEFI
jgi:hypothetical protein